jgi:hypothetical protein
MTSGLTADDLPLLVSVHLPKTAGTSFRAALQAHYGNKLLEDYAMLPMQVPRGRREWQSLRDAYNARDQITPSTRAIHGHFLPVKYRLALRQRHHLAQRSCRQARVALPLLASRLRRR